MNPEQEEFASDIFEEIVDAFIEEELLDPDIKTHERFEYFKQHCLDQILLRII